MKPSVVRFVLLLTAVVSLAIAGCKKAAEPVPAASSNAVVQSGAVELKLKLPVGSRFTQRMELSQSSVTVMPNMPKPMNQEVLMNQEVNVSVVKEREGGGRELELQFGDVDMSISMNGGARMMFDSRGEAAGEVENPAAAGFRALVGQKVKVLLDSSNRVEKVEGVSNLVSRMKGRGPGGPRNFIANMFNEDYFKQMADFGAAIPDHPVQPGDRWPVKKDVMMGPLGGVTIALTYTFKSWEQHEKRNCARLDFTGDITGKAGKGGGQPGSNMSVSDGKCSGTSWFDPELGLTVDSDFDQKMTMLISFATSPGPGGRVDPGSPAITNLLDQRIHLKLLPEEQK